MLHRATTEAVLRPLPSLARIVLLSRGRRVRALLLSLAAPLLLLRLADFESVHLLARTPPKWLRDKVLFENLILRLRHLEDVNQLSIPRVVPLAVVP